MVEVWNFRLANQMTSRASIWSWVSWHKGKAFPCRNLPLSVFRYPFQRGHPGMPRVGSAPQCAVLAKQRLKFGSLCRMFFSVFSDQLFDVHQLPAHGGQIGGLRTSNGLEFRYPVMQAKQESLRVLVEAGLDVGRQLFSGFQEVAQGDRFLGHALEFPRIRSVKIDQVRVEKLVRGARRARDINQEGAEQIVRQTFVFVEEFDVIKVARVLAVEGGMELPTEQVFEGDDLHLRISEFILDGFGDRAGYRFVNDAPCDR